MKSSVTLELLQHPAFGPMLDPPNKVAQLVGQLIQLWGEVGACNKYSVPSAHVLHSPVIKNNSPSMQCLREILMFRVNLDSPNAYK